MRITISLDNESSVQFDKVQDELANRVLPAELHTEFFISQLAPEDPFWQRHLSPEFTTALPSLPFDVVEISHGFQNDEIGLMLGLNTFYPPLIPPIRMGGGMRLHPLIFVGLLDHVVEEFLGMSEDGRSDGKRGLAGQFQTVLIV